MTVLHLSLTARGLAEAERPSFRRARRTDGRAEPGLAGVEGLLRGALAALPPGAPVVVMVHGRGYAPGHRAHCPHALLFTAARDGGPGRILSWPRRLGLAGSAIAERRGLAVGLGWNGRGDIWTAAAAAERTAPELARLVTLMRRLDPARPVDLVGHSLGARVILGALPRLHAGAVGRVILLAGAEFAARAEAALDTPAGRLAEVVNVLSRENDLFDWGFETALAPLSGRRALGAGLGHLANAVDVQIDGRATARALARLGFRLAPPDLRVCHWSVYLRPGVFPLYRALIHQRDELTLDRLRAALGTAPEPRWSRLPRALSFGPFRPSLPV